MNIDLIKKRTDFLEFLEISRYSFDSFHEGKKPKEGYVQKKTNRGSFVQCIFCLLPCFCKTWQKRWFVLKDDMICYLDNSSSSIGKDV